MSKIHPKEPDRVSLALLPTPVVELRNLSRVLQSRPIFMKRDDLTGLELSGNKIRKLEYLLADAQAQQCDCLVTYGGYQSNHCRATAAAGARMGMHVRLILRSPAGTTAPDNDGNLFLDRLFGAEISLHSPDEFNQHRQKLIDQAIAELRGRGHKPYYFTVGASVPLGCWGYIRCVHELADQIGRETKVDLFVPVSSAGTYAGVILGVALLGLRNWRAVGVPVSDSAEHFRRGLRSLERAANEIFALGLAETDVPIELLDGFIGEGYAIPYPAALETLRLLTRAEGILLDPTYTSKAMTGMIDAIRRGNLRDGATPVFLHTGGSFGLLARRDLFPAELK